MRFGRKNSNQNLRLKGEIKELGHGNAGEGRSTSLASNPRIKTYQNSLKSQIDPKHELGLFLVEFSNFMGKIPNRWEIRGNQKLLIPDDEGVNLLGGPIFTDLVVKSMGKRGEREKVAEANTRLAKNTMNTHKTHTIQGRLLPNGGHWSDRILTRKDRSTSSLKSTP